MPDIIKIADAFNVTITAQEGDTSVTIADLAKNVTFDKQDAYRYDTQVWCIAFDALEDEYGAFEKADGNADYYEGAWMTFKDGSTIRFGGM